MTEKDEITVEWFDGHFYPPEDIRALFDPYEPESATLIGTEGAIHLPNGQMPRLYPGDKFKDVKKPDLEPRNHYHHFLDAIHGTAKNESYFEQTGPMTEAILLGTVAIRTPGETLAWDSAKLAITNNKAAHALLRRTYRDGWSVGGF
jgi:hypothetical protein